MIKITAMIPIIYINLGEGPRSIERDLFELDAAGYVIDLSRVVVDRCSQSIPAQQRPGLQDALQRAVGGNTLVVTRMEYLGSSVMDIAQLLESLAPRRIQLTCQEFGFGDLATAGEGSPAHLLRLAARVEDLTRRERARMAAAQARFKGIKTGRPSALAQEQRPQVLTALAQGQTVSAVARTFNTSRQTIIRIRESALPVEKS